MRKSAIENIAGLIVNIAFVTRPEFEDRKEDVDKIVDALIGIRYDKQVAGGNKKVY